MRDKLSRRKLLAGIGAGVATGVAGCSGATSESKKKSNKSRTGQVETTKNAIEDVRMNDEALVVQLRKFELANPSLSDPTTVDYVAILEQGTRKKVSKREAVHSQLQYRFPKLQDGNYTVVVYGESQSGDGDTYWTAHYLSFAIENNTVDIQGGRVQK